MSDKIEKCFTETIYRPQPCFGAREGELSCEVKITECGLDLEGVPENEQTRELFEAARMTGLSTILSVADAMEVARKNVEETDQNRLKQEAHRFYENAKGLIQKIKGDHS